MLTPDYLLHISEGAEDIAQVLHTDIVYRIVERITARANRHDDYMFTSLDRWQLQALTDSGIMMEDIIADIAKATNKQSDEIRQAMEDAGIKTVRYDDKIFRAAGLEPNSLSPGVMRIMERNYRATMGEWNNFTRTIADSSQQTFIQAMDRAYILTSSGAVGYTQAFMEAINMVVRDGVTVYYPSGHRDTLETAALRCVRTGISQMSAQVTERRMDEMGVDLVLVSSHMGARPSHAVWQGKVFSLSGRDRKYPELRSSTGYGTVTGLCGANCRHNFSPYYEGMENPFDHYDSEENKKLYDETQQQRALERRIRRTKREMEGYKTAQDSAEGELAEQAKAQYERKAALLKKQTAEYNEFCKDHDLRPLRDRLQIAKAGRETFVTVPDVKIEPPKPKKFTPEYKADVLIERCKLSGVEYKEPKPLEKKLTTQEIIDKIGGGDLTKGSCSSLALAYCGNKGGLDVRDFRGGDSCSIFARNRNIDEIVNIAGGEGLSTPSDFTSAMTLLGKVEEGKEYYFTCGRHAAIVRKIDGRLEYLELQSAYSNGFHPLDKDVLRHRFGCKRSHSTYGMKYEIRSVLIEAEKLSNNTEIDRLMGYINTDVERKGVRGYVK